MHRVLFLLAVTFLTSCDSNTPPETLQPPGTKPPTGSVPRASVCVNCVHPISAKLVSMIRPTLPAEAKRAGIKGPVFLEIEIDESGHISVLRVARGDPALNDDAVRAASRWKYEPAVLDGKPIRYITTIAISFQEK
jgi:TonB family protein